VSLLQAAMLCTQYPELMQMRVQLADKANSCPEALALLLSRELQLNPPPSSFLHTFQGAMLCKKWHGAHT
jgi:hypothetical protein